MAATALDHEASRQRSSSPAGRPDPEPPTGWRDTGTFAQLTLFLNISEIYILYIYIIFFG